MSMNDTANPDPATANPHVDRQPGPFNSTFTKTFEIQGPIKFVFTETMDSTHVPPSEPAPCGGCGGHAGGDDTALLAKYIPAIAALVMQHIKQAQGETPE